MQKYRAVLGSPQYLETTYTKLRNEKNYLGIIAVGLQNHSTACIALALGIKVHLEKISQWEVEI
jgi:hypothetical protein